MSTRFAIIVLAGCLICVATGFSEPLVADNGREVNTFFKELLGVMTSPDTRAAHVAELVIKNKGTAKRCLPLLKSKAEPGGDKAEAYRLLHARLEEIVLLTGPGVKCDDPTAQRLEQAARQQLEVDDKLFYLGYLARMCPRNRQLLVDLGDLSFKLRQFGVAADAFKKALLLQDDPDTRTLLARAEEHTATFKDAGPITAGDVRKLFKQGLMSPQPGLTRKVDLVNAIQTNQIRFDEWSAALKDEFKDQLKAVGEVAGDEFRAHRSAGLLIEGHTDRRGPLERNDKLSLDRAESIKSWLVANFGLDPSRLRTMGYGPRRPFTAAEAESGWALNRRVEFKKIDDLNSGQ